MLDRMNEDAPQVTQVLALKKKEHGSQGIAEKYARDCRNFVGGRRNTRRRLGAESLQKILKWKGTAVFK